MEHVCIPLAAVITRVTLEPAVSVMLAPLDAVALTLLPVGPSAAKLLVPLGYWNVIFNRLKLDVMLSLDDGGGCASREARRASELKADTQRIHAATHRTVATFGGGGARGGGVPKMY
jgi:hypothetical protein